MSFNHTTCYDDICNVPAKTMTLQGISERMSGLTGWVKCAFDVYRQRRHLAQLSTSELSDLGLSRKDAQVEAARPFWDLPDDMA